MKLLCIAGARPNFMKIGPLMEAFGSTPGIEPALVHTGQHYGLKSREYALVTLHRPSNVDTPEALANTLDILALVQEELPVFLPLHPRTRQNLDRFRWHPGREHDLAGAVCDLAREYRAPDHLRTGQQPHRRHESGSGPSDCPGATRPATVEHRHSSSMERASRPSHCEHRSAELGARNSEFGVWSAELGTRNSELGTRNAELGAGNSEFGVWNSELGTRSLKRGRGKPKTLRVAD